MLCFTSLWRQRIRHRYRQKAFFGIIYTLVSSFVCLLILYFFFILVKYKEGGYYFLYIQRFFVCLFVFIWFGRIFYSFIVCFWFFPFFCSFFFLSYFGFFQFSFSFLLIRFFFLYMCIVLSTFFSLYWKKSNKMSLEFFHYLRKTTIFSPRLCCNFWCPIGKKERKKVYFSHPFFFFFLFWLNALILFVCVLCVYCCSLICFLNILFFGYYHYLLSEFLFMTFH